MGESFTLILQVDAGWRWCLWNLILSSYSSTSGGGSHNYAPYFEMHRINSGKPQTASSNHSSIIVGQLCQLLIGTMSSQFKSYSGPPATLLTGTWMNGCWICGYWRHSRHTVIWLYDPFDSWSPQIPGDPEATTPASACSGRRRGKLPLSEPHLDRCSVRWSLGSKPAPTLTASWLKVSLGKMSH